MNRQNQRRVLLFLIGLTTATLLFFYPQECRQAAVEGLQLCCGPLLIGIFPFLIISNLIATSGCSNLLAAPFRPLGRLLGCSNPAGDTILLLGALGGFAPAAVCAATLCKTNELEPSCADYLLAAAATSSPAFVILAVGDIMLGSRTLGVQLYLVQLLSAYLSVGLYRLFVARRCRTVEPNPSKQHPSDCRPAVFQSLSDSIGSASLTYLKLSSFVVYFRILSDGLAAALPIKFAMIPSLILELSTGCSYAAQRPIDAVYWCCAVLSLQSFSVLLQIRAICPPELSLKPLLAIRPMHLILSILLLKGFLGNESTTTVFNSLETRLIVLPRLSPSCALLLFLLCVIISNELCRTLHTDKKTL